MTDYPNALPPLGPITTYEERIRVRPSQTTGEGGWLDATYYLDERCNEYTSVGHVLRCAVAKELGL